ncbi:MAG TPA: 3-deoxy-manno-octulosonate cytidylyltransferase [Gemmatimonadaceae bacterium]|nr:3-deoxy-manno-octulosonate cytidylyltransferase [Gemmatimonadaceae bacterium]
MRTLAVIPARLGATRLPRKPLRLLAGLPLVVRVWQRVLDAGFADRVVIATDSREVADAAAAAGADAVMTSSAHGSGTERVAEVARRSEFGDFDVIANVQGDEPFVSRRALIESTQLVTASRFAVGTAAVIATPEILRDPNVVKVVAADDGRAMYFSRAAVPYLREAEDAELQRTCVWQHIGVYAYARSALMRWVQLPPNPLERIERLEQLRPLAAGIPIGVVLIDEPVRPGIDTEHDLEQANRNWSAFITG